MTTQEMIEKVNKIAENANMMFVGIRFENKERENGEFIEECSKDNSDRQDEREFPEYGTDEYEEMEELNGVCAYSYESNAWVQKSYKGEDLEDVEKHCFANHCYVIGTDDCNIGYGEDDGEVIMPRATVLSVIF